MIQKLTPWQLAVIAVRLLRVLEIAAGAGCVAVATKACWLMLTAPSVQAASLMAFTLACVFVVFWDTPLFNIRIETREDD